jgi:hypothetical protein
MPTSPTPCAVLVGSPSYLRGQYPHNHSILGTSLLEGGEKKFRQLGRDRSTIATWLDTRATGPSSHLPGQASILRPFLFLPLFTNGVEVWNSAKLAPCSPKHPKKPIWEMRPRPHGSSMSQGVQGVRVASAAKGKGRRTMLDEATVAEPGRAIAAE